MSVNKTDMALASQLAGIVANCPEARLLLGGPTQQYLINAKPSCLVFIFVLFLRQDIHHFASVGNPKTKYP
ncbi:hypothetical protein OAN307_c27070 [Octadecabacter antarcticus 307]|uniref:Uncharacterized protein n=1 Tax=Octadecabacter antarcticus 307 TaxID=391626 RepID=M9R6J6_9RHOB|nr:hypothetical protein [Octadecabacter antarcticus]AGI68284.1 hypothetical protein OAN307_c27070 [Octadecabacter antarcticus 307]